VLAAHRYPRDGKPLFDVAQIRPWWTTVEGRALLAAIALPPALTILLGLVLDAQLSSLWSIPFFVFFPFLMVACLPANLAERYRFVLPMLLGGFCVVALLLAPTMKRYTLSIGRSNSAIPIDQIAMAVQAKWNALTDKPLRIVAGENNFLANGVSFYSNDVLCETAALRADCRQLAEGLLGRVDAREVFTVTMPSGAPAPDEREYQVYFRLPAV
jgi:hypothetical protein